MKHFFSVCFLFFALSFLTDTIAAQDFDYDRYKSRTLSELIDLNNPKLEDSTKKQFIISGDWFYSHVRLKYIGTSRLLSTERKELLNNWKKSFDIKAEIVDLFEKEYLFKECDKDYWLLVQKPVAAFFPKELKEGEMVTLYLFFGGGVKSKEKSDYLFLVNEFVK